MPATLPKLETCLNCGAPVSSNFCADCGQENEDQTASVKSVLGDFFDDIAHFDSRLVRTIIPLLIRPGFLTNQYNDGKRVRYLSPYKLYLSVTFVFFLLFSYSSTTTEILHRNTTEYVNGKLVADNVQAAGNALNEANNEIQADDDDDPDDAKAAKAAIKIAQNKLRPLATTVAKSAKPVVSGAGEAADGDDSDIPGTVAAYEQQQVKLPPASQDSWFMRFVKERYIAYKQNKTAFKQSIIDDLPKMAFFQVPLFALSLKLLYLRRKRFYVEHLIFSLHCHAFVFICFTLLLLTKAPFSTYIGMPGIVGHFINIIAWSAMVIYLYAAMKVVYKQSYGKTLVKYLIAAWSYSVLLVMTFMLILVYAFVVG